MIAGLKPYAEYKDSGSNWLGLVPDGWQVQSLRSLIGKRAERNRPDLPLLSVAREKGVFVRSLTDADENHNVIPDDLSNYKVARAGNLVINKMKAWQGSMGIAPCDGIVSPAYFVFDLRMANAAFGQRLLRSKPYVAHFAQASDGVRVGQWDLSIPGMREIPVLVPSPNEQTAIVCFLDHANRKIDGFIRAKRKLIALLNEQKQAIIHRAVTRGLDPDVPLKPSGIEWLGDIPAHWELTPLKGVCKIQSGITLGKTYTGESLVELPYLRVANVQAGYLSLLSVKTLKLPLDEAKRSMLQAGDVLMTEGGDPDKLGRGCLWNAQIDRCVHQNHIFAVRTAKMHLLPEYFAALLESRYARLYFLRSAKQTTNLASTNKTTIGQFRLPLPPITEQVAILAAMSREMRPVVATITRTEREIALMQEYRIRLTADIVTGKLDVRAAATSLPEIADTAADETLVDATADELEFEDTE